MEKLQELSGILAGILSLAAFFPYIYSILRGKTKPSMASWLIWFVVGVLLLASYGTSGAKYTLWMPLSYVLGPLVIVVLTFRNSEPLTKLEVSCLFLAAFSLFVWFFSRSNTLALCMHLTIDCMGVVPTIRKSYKRPQEESKIAWSMIFVGSVFNLLAVDSYDFNKTSYPLYMFMGNGLIFLFVFRKPTCQKE